MSTLPKIADFLKHPNEMSECCALALGWRCFHGVRINGTWHAIQTWVEPKYVKGFDPSNPHNGLRAGATFPLFHECLNQMAKAEATLTESEYYIFRGALARIQDAENTGWFSQQCISASATQRIAAWLVAKNKAIFP